MAYKHFFKRIIQFCYTFSNESSTERKNSTASHRNPKKTTTFAFNKRSVTSMRKCPIVQHVESDSGHSTKRLKRGGTTRICKAVKYNDLHLSPHSVYLSKQRLYRLKWIVTDNQWCKYAPTGNLSPEMKIRKAMRIARERALRIFIPGVLQVATVGISGFLQPER